MRLDAILDRWHCHRQMLVKVVGLDHGGDETSIALVALVVDAGAHQGHRWFADHFLGIDERDGSLGGVFVKVAVRKRYILEGVFVMGCRRAGSLSWYVRISNVILPPVNPFVFNSGSLFFKLLENLRLIAGFENVKTLCAFDRAIVPIKGTDMDLQVDFIIPVPKTYS